MAVWLGFPIVQYVPYHAFVSGVLLRLVYVQRLSTAIIRSCTWAMQCTKSATKEMLVQMCNAMNQIRCSTIASCSG